MPANKKHLTHSPWQRFAKLTAGFFGGYLLTVTFFIALSFWIDYKSVLLSLRFAGFLLWAVLLLLAFLAENGWKVWGIYLSLSLGCATVIYFSQIYHPIF